MCDLRRKLQQITCYEVSVQPEKIQELCRSYGCSINLNPAYDPCSRETYNCFEYALHLNESVHINVRATCADLGVLVDFRFIDYLLSLGNLTEASESSARKCGLLIYFTDAMAQHSGHLRNGRVTSKWGSGLLWDHSILEVPVKFGDPRFFNEVQSDKIKNCFLEYARERGIEEEYLQDA